MREEAMMQMLVRGHNLRLLDEGSGGRQQHPAPEHQDNQHKLSQPKRALPENKCPKSHVRCLP